MKIYKYPAKAIWESLMKRPTIDRTDLETTVNAILSSVKARGDRALFEYAERFDNAIISELSVSKTEFAAARKSVTPVLQAAIQTAKTNIEKFHTIQRTDSPKIETTEGVFCWRKSVGIEKVGLYIPGGTAPLFSTILMLGIPAQIAGCREIILCSPPDKSGAIHPAILYTAQLVGITKIYKVGGAQAIAAMAYGTESIPQVYKIFGPGNQYVTKAKELVQQAGLAIDMPAGPSEVLVIADDTCQPAFVAADLLSQAEHGMDSQVILLTDKEQVANDVINAISEQLPKLPRQAIAAKALENSRVILLKNIENCIEWSNVYAPEHLILAMDRAEAFATKITNAGSVFLGHYSCESAGDYASGTNHTLPTNGFAKNYSGVSVDSFVKKITFQKLTKTGIQNLGPSIEVMATAEELMAHKEAVSMRLRSLEGPKSLLPQ